MTRTRFLFGILGGLLLSSSALAGELPQGYLVWSKGTADDAASRQLFRMTMPGMVEQQALTAGEDVEPRISPDGKWIAYGKAKFLGGSDYHDFRLWQPYIVSIHGAGNGRKEIKIDDDGAWPSWSSSGALFYNQADGTQSRIMRVELDDRGRVARKDTWLVTKDIFSEYAELNECFVAPDESWFAGRTRGNTLQNGVSAFSVAPAQSFLLARAGSIGCMPFVAPSGVFGIIAGAGEGIRWGHSPFVANRIEDQLLIPPLSASHLAYHPGISTDEKWVLAAQGTDTDHNAGRYDLYIHPLDTATMTAGAGQVLTADGFNGWPHLWIGVPGPPPPPDPVIDDFHASSYTVSPGDTVTLTWSTFGADIVALDGIPVADVGSQNVQPAVSTSYALSASSSLLGQGEARSLTITVNATPLPVTFDPFAATPPRIIKGSSTVLSWQVSNATTLDLDGVSVSPVGTREVSPLVTTTYVLTAQGQTGPGQASVTVVVGELASGLVPDRGGFVCTLNPATGRSGKVGLVALGLAAVVVANLWRRSRRRR